MNKDALLQRLTEVQQLAEGSRWRRMRLDPLRYAGAYLYRRLLYPRLSSGRLRRADTFFGVPMHIELPAALDIFLLGAKTHDSEIRLSRFLIQTLQPGDVFVDVGAHFGFYSLLGGLLCTREGKVLALEASSRSFALLEKNAGRMPQIRPLHLAASDREGKMHFYEFPVLYSEYNSMNKDQYRNRNWLPTEAPREIVVPARRLDSLLSDMALRPKLIKIDVEGGEAQVIGGATALLAGETAPMIAMEYLDERRITEAHRRALQLLKDFGYQPFRIEQDGRLRPCNDPDAYLKKRRLDSDNLLFRRPAG